MSYILSIVKNDIPSAKKAAWKYLEELPLSREEETPAEFVNLIDKLTKKYPCISTLPDYELHTGVWSDGPLINNALKNIVTIGIARQVNHLVPFVIDTALKMGFAVFDIQMDKIYKPSKKSDKRNVVDTVDYIFDGLEEFMGEYGFKPVKEKQKFEKEVAGSIYRVQVYCSKHGPSGYFLTFNFQLFNTDFLAVIKKIEKALNIETINNVHWMLVTSGAPHCPQAFYDPKRQKDYVINSEEEILDAIEKFKINFVKTGIPFFERFSVIEAMEEECNKDSKKPSPYFIENPYKGIILAKMVGREDLDRLGQKAKDLLIRENDKGEKLDSYLKLVDDIVVLEI